MSRFYFSAIEELFPIFDDGVQIVLWGGSVTMGTYMHWRGDAHSFPHVIKMRSQEPFDRKNAPWDTTTLEEIQTTLVHELVHAFRQLNGWEGCLPRRPESQYEIDYETDIDRFAYDVVRNKPQWVDGILSELLQRSNCGFDYKVKETPFIGYQKIILKKLLETAGVRPRFGDHRQLNVLRWAQTLDISLPTTL